MNSSKSLKCSYSVGNYSFNFIFDEMSKPKLEKIVIGRNNFLENNFLTKKKQAIYTLEKIYFMIITC